MCDFEVNGTLSISIDGAGLVSGTANAFEQSAAVAGTIDGVGAVSGNASIPGLGACNLDGTIGLALVGSGTFNCPTVPCTGTWNLASV